MAVPFCEIVNTIAFILYFGYNLVALKLFVRHRIMWCWTFGPVCMEQWMRKCRINSEKVLLNVKFGEAFEINDGGGLYVYHFCCFFLYAFHHFHAYEIMKANHHFRRPKREIFVSTEFHLRNFVEWSSCCRAHESQPDIINVSLPSIRLHCWLLNDLCSIAMQENESE